MARLCSILHLSPQRFQFCANMPSTSSALRIHPNLRLVPRTSLPPRGTHSLSRNQQMYWIETALSFQQAGTAMAKSPSYERVSNQHAGPKPTTRISSPSRNQIPKHTQKGPVHSFLFSWVVTADHHLVRFPPSFSLRPNRGSYSNTMRRSLRTQRGTQEQHSSSPSGRKRGLAGLLARVGLSAPWEAALSACLVSRRRLSRWRVGVRGTGRVSARGRDRALPSLVQLRDGCV